MKFRRFRKVTKTVGSLCLLFSFIFVPPIVVSFIYQDGVIYQFIESLFITLAIGSFLWLPLRFSIASALIIVTLTIFHTYSSLFETMINSLFTVVSMITSTGFVTADYTYWPVFVPFFLIFVGFIGGCGGSTAGGMKVIRILILFKLVGREMKQLLHPSGIFHVQLNGQKRVANKTLQSVFGFFSLYVASFVVLLLLMIFDGVDQVTAFSAIATCMNNMGPGLGDVSQSFAGLDDTAKMISVASMLLGRLEVVSVLVILTPEYWKT